MNKYTPSLLCLINKYTPSFQSLSDTISNTETSKQQREKEQTFIFLLAPFHLSPLRFSCVFLLLYRLISLSIHLFLSFGCFVRFGAFDRHGCWVRESGGIRQSCRNCARFPGLRLAVEGSQANSAAASGEQSSSIFFHPRRDRDQAQRSRSPETGIDAFQILMEVCSSGVFSFFEFLLSFGRFVAC